MIDRAMDDGFRLSEDLEEEFWLLDDQCNRDDNSRHKLTEEGEKGKLPVVESSDPTDTAARGLPHGEGRKWTKPFRAWKQRKMIA